MWDQLAGELNFPFERRGDYVVAIGEEERPLVEKLMQQGIKNGVPGMVMLDAGEMRSRERDINPDVSGALLGNDRRHLRSLPGHCRRCRKRGYQWCHGSDTKFEDFIWEGNRVIGVKTNRGDFFARWVRINSAGIYSDAVMSKLASALNFSSNHAKVSISSLTGRKSNQ